MYLMDITMICQNSYWISHKYFSCICQSQFPLNSVFFETPCRLGNLGLLVVHDSTFSHHCIGRDGESSLGVFYHSDQRSHGITIYWILKKEPRRCFIFFSLFFFFEIRVLEDGSEISQKNGIV